MFNDRYDDSDVASILQHAKQVEKHTLREYLVGIDGLDKYESTHRGKGGFGAEVEKFLFGYEPNGDPRPDFPKVGLELKVSPLKIGANNKKSPKERIVLSMINYTDIVSEDWYTNSLLKKLQFLLLMFYVHNKDVPSIDLLFDLVSTWQPSKKDLEIIKNDWETIHNKIKDGKAHEISEGDTLYLGACTKAADSTKRTKQPNSTELAKPRAFSLKQSYVRSIWDELNHRAEKELTTGSDFETYVKNKFKSLYGLTINEIGQTLGIDAKSLRTSKNFISRFMSSVQKALFNQLLEESAEFSKSGIRIKNILLKPNGIPKEDMSFPQIQYKDIVEQEWDKSDIKEMFENEKHLWLIFKATKQYAKQTDLSLDEIVFEKAMFWNMPGVDLEGAMYELWKDTVAKIKRGDYEHFIKASEGSVGHIRPKARDAKDKMQTPQGTFEKKKCFWLNKQYVANQINTDS